MEINRGGLERAVLWLPAIGAAGERGEGHDISRAKTKQEMTTLILSIPIISAYSNWKDSGPNVCVWGHEGVYEGKSGGQGTHGSGSEAKRQRCPISGDRPPYTRTNPLLIPFD